MRQVWTLVILWCLRKIMRETWFVVHLGGRSESEQLKALNLQKVTRLERCYEAWP
jgi:hypothetical protein